MSESRNIAARLSKTAKQWPHQLGVAFPEGRDRQGRVTYSQLTFQQLDRESDRLARGLVEMGVKPGTRLVLMVKPSLEFIALTFAIFKSGAINVLIDPGMGRSNIFRCLEEVDPQGFVAIPIVHVIRKLNQKKFPNARLNVAVGAKLPGRSISYEQLLGDDWSPFEIPECGDRDPAAIIFTSGSTGPPKGVLYEHGMFNAQVDQLQSHYGIQPGEVDLPGFPLFALFNAAMGVSTIIPDMDPTKPALVNPERILEAIHNHGVTQAFGSPALWNRVGRYCRDNNIRIPSLKRVLSAGAPVPYHVLQTMREVLSEDGADMFTPYGATESLPVCSISATEVLEETSHQTRLGAGTCVGHHFSQIDVRVIEVSDEPLKTISDATPVETGSIGEIIVRGPVATREYYRRDDATALAKIADGDGFWHRMGDVGYFDDSGRLWFCGRKAHIVHTADGPMFTIRVEAIFNEHPDVFRSALVGVGERGRQRPVIIVEPEDGKWPGTAERQKEFTAELIERAKSNPLTESVETVLFHQSLPVDIRHNVKIFREKLAPWAAEQLNRA